MTYESYNTKVIISGKRLEAYHYEQPVIKPTHRHGGRRKSSDKPSLHEVEHQKTSLHRALLKIKRLLSCNFGESSSFITLTFNQDKMPHVHDINSCKKHFNHFVKSFRRRYSNLKYLCVMEFQDQTCMGGIHFHLVANVINITHQELQMLWQLGYVWVTEVEDDTCSIDRIACYMTKGLNDPRLGSHRKYLRSKNLISPQELKGTTAEQCLISLDMHEKDLITDYAFESKYHGEIRHQEYLIWIVNSKSDNFFKGFLAILNRRQLSPYNCVKW
ncbi:rolling circle replication-associated protein [Paenibacillus naphthalenovorans]|uniref:rolling circle replication-associated protein n=1 Tax=Paenibacillus naphthalenovorans TaxID=162209 RepID=UPI003D2905D8